MARKNRSPRSALERHVEGILDRLAERGETREVRALEVQAGFAGVRREIGREVFGLRDRNVELERAREELVELKRDLGVDACWVCDERPESVLRAREREPLALVRLAPPLGVHLAGRRSDVDELPEVGDEDASVPLPVALHLGALRSRRIQ